MESSCRVREIVSGLCAALISGLILVGCSTERETASVASASQTMEETQPRLATYDCGEAGSVVLENNKTTVLMTGTEGEAIELAAVPESAGSRYANGGTAIVLEGADMLLMANRQEPVNCHR